MLDARNDCEILFNFLIDINALMVYNINMKVILPVKEIPVGSVVTKLNGQKKYQVRDRITIYDEVKNSSRDITLEMNTRVLWSVDLPMSVNIISGDTEMIWDADYNALQSYLYEKYELDQK